MSVFDFACVCIERFGPWAILLFVLVYMLLKPEKILFISSKFFLLFSRFSSSCRKKAVSTKIRGSILSASKIITKDCPAAAPFDLKIEWVKSTSRETFFKGNQIVVRMNEKDHSDRNMVYAVHAYAAKGFIPYARTFMSNVINTALNMALTKKILSICSDSSLREFYDSIYEIYKKDPRIDNLYHSLMQADHNGIFTRIYLNEISKTSYLLKELEPGNAVAEEIKEFTDYVVTIANRQIGDQTPLIFNQNFIHIGVVLPSSSWSFGETDVKRGAKRVSKLFSKGCKTVYILAIGTKMEIAKGISALVNETNDFMCASKSDYYKHVFKDGRIKWGICIELQPVNINAKID